MTNSKKFGKNEMEDVDNLNDKSLTSADKHDSSKMQRSKRRGRKKRFDETNFNDDEDESMGKKNAEDIESSSSKILENEDEMDTTDDGKSKKEEFIVNKRRRKKAIPKVLPIEYTIYSSENNEQNNIPDRQQVDLTDLQQGHRILEEIMQMSAAAVFINKPNPCEYRMERYYEVIKDPIWFQEIKNKYENDQYNTVTQLMFDIRRVIENCYRYWGINNPLAIKALRLEKKIEHKISQLPPSIGELCSLKATHGIESAENGNYNSDNEEEDVEEESLAIRYYNQIVKKDGFESKLLKKTLKEAGVEFRMPESALSLPKENSFPEVKNEVKVWEDNVLLPNQDDIDQITSMWELPVIGHFFNLTFNILYIPPISQLELERMLLMPQASATLANVMTAVLLPPLLRLKLNAGPSMPYSMWSAKLKNKVSSWYRLYKGACGHSLKVFEQIGVEPDFWDVMGVNNPLKDHEFHELSFKQRVWLLKSLCDYLMHNHKTVIEVINNIEPDDLREMILGKDKSGHIYRYFPDFNEPRIYKEAKEDCVDSLSDADPEDSKNANEYNEEKLLSKTGGIKKFLFHPSKSKMQCRSFKLVASSVEELRSLIRDLKKDNGKNCKLMSRLESVLNYLIPLERCLVETVVYIREKMYKEWNNYSNRNPNYVDPGVSYWEREEKKASVSTPEQNPASGPSNDSEQNPVPGPSNNSDNKRERRSKRESQMRMMSYDLGQDLEDDEEEYFVDTESEDEWTDRPQKKKKKTTSEKKIKKLNALLVEQQSSILKSQQNIMLQPNSSLSVKIKKEIDDDTTLLQDVKTKVTIKEEITETPLSSLKVKEELIQEDVINISDDEDVDVKPVIADLMPIKTVDCFLSLNDPQSQNNNTNTIVAASTFSTRAVDSRLTPKINQVPVKTEPFSTFTPPVTPNQGNRFMAGSPNFKNETSNRFNTASSASPISMVSMSSNIKSTKPINNLNRSPIGIRSPSTINRSPNIINRSPGIINRSPGIINRSPGIINRSPVLNNRSPILNNRSPILNNRSPILNNRSPILNNRSPSTQQNFPSPSSQRGRATSFSVNNMRSPFSMSPLGRGRPRLQSPNFVGGRQPSPQFKSPTNMMGISPLARQRSPAIRYSSPNNQQGNPQLLKTTGVRRNLNMNFGPGTRLPPQEPPLLIVDVANTRGKKVKIVEGKLSIGLIEGIYMYQVVLSDGGIVSLTNAQINDLKQKNNGILPSKVGLPMVIES